MQRLSGDVYTTPAPCMLMVCKPVESRETESERRILQSWFTVQRLVTGRSGGSFIGAGVLYIVWGRVRTTTGDGMVMGCDDVMMW